MRTLSLFTHCEASVTVTVYVIALGGGGVATGLEPLGLFSPVDGLQW